MPMATYNGKNRLLYVIFSVANTAMVIIVVDARAFHAVWPFISILTVFDMK